MSLLDFILGKKELDHGMSVHDIKLVQASFVRVSHIKQFPETFYQYLFEIDPTLRPLFKSDMKIQGQRFMTMLSNLVAGLNDLTGLTLSARWLGEIHSGYGIKDEHYGAAGAALLFALKSELSDQWSEELRQAWIAMYTMLAVEMKLAAAHAA